MSLEFVWPGCSLQVLSFSTDFVGGAGGGTRPARMCLCLFALRVKWLFHVLRVFCFSVIKGRVHGACGLTDQGEYQSRSLKFLCQ